MLQKGVAKFFDRRIGDETKYPEAGVAREVSGGAGVANGQRPNRGRFASLTCSATE